MDTTVSDPLVGQVVDERYRVVSRIARGGMATVYEAVDMRLERTVALKVMHPSLAEDADFVARFVREARSAARLSHPNVVAMFDQGTDGRLVFLVMEYVPSLNLREVLRDRGRLTVQEAFDVIEPVLAALTAAHTAGIVHRDVKPENVLLAQDGRVLVADFGLARATSNATSAATQGVLIGTVAYLAPEQVERGIADPRSDVYAAGIVLYEMLTGAPPFAGETPLSVAYQHVNGIVPPPSESVEGLPPAVDALLAVATARDADERYSDAGRFLEALRATRQRIGLPVWTAVSASSPHSLTDTLIVPRPAAAEPGAQHTAVVEREPVVAAAAGGAAGAAAAGAGSEPPEKTPRAQRRRRRIRGAIVIGVILALAVGLGAYAFQAGATKYTNTPAVATLTRDAAGTKIRAADLTPVAGPQLFSETVEKGLVIRTAPGPGERVKTGSNVVMTISKGPERYAVPKLKGLSESDAKKAITEANLAVGEIDEAWSSSVPKNDVISSSPAAGKALKKNTVVDLVVSKGPQPVTVPNVKGKPRASAVATLRNLGLVPSITSETYSETVANGAVISQSPGNGAKVDKGSTISLVISKGPPPVAVPNVVGQSLSSARSRLEALGLKVSARKLLPGPTLNRVYNQSPSSGTVPKGSTITLGYV